MVSAITLAILDILSEEQLVQVIFNFKENSRICFKWKFSGEARRVFETRYQGWLEKYAAGQIQILGAKLSIKNHIDET